MKTKWIFNFIYFLFLVFSSQTHAQEYKLKGKVINMESKSPVPYAVVLLEGTPMGASADESGSFEFLMADSFIKPVFIVQSLGFKKGKFRINNIDKQKEIVLELKPDIYQLNEVSVSGNLKNYIIGAKRQSNILGSGFHSIFDDTKNIFLSQNAIFFKNHKNKPGHFKNVSFFITNKGFPQAPFRIRIYEVEGDSNKPGKDLLQESVIVSAQKGGKWFKVDLDQYHVRFPDKGCIVALEWVITDSKYYFENEWSKERNYGVVLGVTTEFKENLHWWFSSEHLWQKFIYPVKININPMIRAEVEIAD